MFFCKGGKCSYIEASYGSLVRMKILIVVKKKKQFNPDPSLKL